MEPGESTNSEFDSATFDLTPMGEVVNRWRSNRNFRAEQFAQVVATASGKSPAEIVAAANVDEAVADLLGTAMTRVAETRHEDYRDALANLVAASLDENAVIDEIEFIANILLRLEPFDLRVLRVGYADRADTLPGSFSPITIAGGLGADEDFVKAACSRLLGAGLVNRNTNVERNTFGGRVVGGQPDVRAVTSYRQNPLGLRAVALCLPRQG